MSVYIISYKKIIAVGRRTRTSMDANTRGTMTMTAALVSSEIDDAFIIIEEWTYYRFFLRNKEHSQA